MGRSPPTRRSKGEGPGTGVAVKVKSSRLSLKFVLKFAGSSKKTEASTLKLIVLLGFTRFENAKGKSAGFGRTKSRSKAVKARVLSRKVEHAPATDSQGVHSRAGIEVQLCATHVDGARK